VAFRLTPHERGFYPLFTRAAQNLVTTADELAKLLPTEPAHRTELAPTIKHCEHVGNELTHAILVKINTTFVTPFDREDIYRLAGALDDVLDAMEEAADRIVLYRLGALPPPKRERMTELEGYGIDVNSLEEDADDLHRTLLGNLLAPPEAEPTTDVLTVLKTREVVDILEDAADAFDAAAPGVIPALTAGISAPAALQWEQQRPSQQQSGILATPGQLLCATT
jgi:uncharacterized protein